MALENLVRKVYFEQTEHYLSETKEELVKIDRMVPRHAANAAAKLLREADFWAEEAGVTTEHPQLWMTTTKLFSALVWRAGI